MIPVILSGGSGTRLWPVSRQTMPKQFCNLLDESLFVKTAKRLAPLGSPWVVTTTSLKILTEKAGLELGLDPMNILYEPFGNNTAPAIALLCRVLEIRGLSEEVVGVFPADHLIEQEQKFLDCVLRGVEWAKRGEVVTLGVKATYAATGYGYIRTSVLEQGAGALKAESFHEKPKIDQAKKFLASGEYFWNAGMFLFKAAKMTDLLREFTPDLAKLFNELKPDLSNLSEIYSRAQNVSIDYAVMEKLGPHICIPCVFDWNDVGSWDAIASLQTEQTDPRILDATKSNYVFPIRDKTYSFVGIEDLVIVDTTDALLIAKKGESEKVKDLVEMMKTRGLQSAVSHTFDFRPWGYYEVLKDTEGFKSKVLKVDIGQRISYQSHAKRSEHWITVSGSGEVIVDEKSTPISRGSYVFIPQGSKHRVVNSGSELLEIVEVQIGSYFGEDDIVRYSDDYGRTT